MSRVTTPTAHHCPVQLGYRAKRSNYCGRYGKWDVVFLPGCVLGFKWVRPRVHQEILQSMFGNGLHHQAVLKNLFVPCKFIFLYCRSWIGSATRFTFPCSKWRPLSFTQLSHQTVKLLWLVRYRREWCGVGGYVSGMLFLHHITHWFGVARLCIIRMHQEILWLMFDDACTISSGFGAHLCSM